MGIRYTQEDFIKVAKEKFGEQYDYSYVTYIKSTIWENDYWASIEAQ